MMTGDTPISGHPYLSSPFGAFLSHGSPKSVVMDDSDAPFREAISIRLALVESPELERTAEVDLCLLMILDAWLIHVE